MLIRVDRLWNWPFQRKSCCSTRFHGIEAELFAEWKSWETLGYQDQDHCALLWNIVHLSTDDTHIAFEIRLKALYKPTVGEICALNLCCTGKEGERVAIGATLNRPDMSSLRRRFSCTPSLPGCFYTTPRGHPDTIFNIRHILSVPSLAAAMHL